MDAELRKDLIGNRWVLISPRRGKRPHDYNAGSNLKDQALQHPGPCAFCYNHENETGPELLSFHHDGCGPNEPCWRVRVVQNKFPAVSSDLPFAEPGNPLSFTLDGELRTHCCMPGFGSHEVVIETPEHDQVFTHLSVDQISEILRAYKFRIESLRKDPRYKYCQIFKNNGNAAGASMVHSHSQIIALPIVPKAPEDEFIGAKGFYERSGGKCLFCVVVLSHFDEGKVRLIDNSPHFISMAPYAARFAYETWILPKKHNSNFGSISNDEIKGLAEILKLTLCKMDKGFGYPPFNFMLQTGPLQDSNLAYYHWYIRIVPHLTSIAGFELGSGCHINPVAPEHAAEFLRGVDVDDEVKEAPQLSDGIIGTTDHDPPQRLINMADLGQNVEKQDSESRRLIHLADLDKPPERLSNMAELGGNDPKPPERLINMAELGENDHQPPLRLIHLADM
jgi:UDPglucose--hexose-1-phosphate uridylyltransferase